MDTSSSGSETQSREMAVSVCAQFVSRADTRQTAIQGTLEARSFSATAAHRSTSSPICIGSVGSRGRERQSGNRSGIEPCEGPGSSGHPGKAGICARGHVRSSTRQSSEVGGSNRGHGPEVQFLQGALARARVAASPPPVDVQLTQCQQFIDRATKLIEDLDRARETESVRLKEAQGRLHRLQQEVAARVSAVPEFAIPGTNDSGAEVAILKAKLAKTEAERDALLAPQQMVDTLGFAGRFGVCRLWFSGQVDSIVGARSCEVARSVRGWRRRYVVAFSTRGRSFCALLKDNWFRVVLLYGLRGVRVGEASNPGPIRQLADSQLPTRRSARLQAMGSTAGHRRGLVVEVIPNVVDAIAVALPPCASV